MIAQLKGILETVEDTWLILDVQGVGYQVFCAAQTLRETPVGTPMTLLIDTHVREDALQLYGFRSVEEKALFRLLTSVQGVGMKVGMALLSLGAASDIIQALVQQNKKYISQADGVGPKLAERVVNELKDKAAKLYGLQSFQGVAGAADLPDMAPLDVLPTVALDVASALQNLGYKPAEAREAVQKALTLNDNADFDTLVRHSLAQLRRA